MLKIFDDNATEDICTRMEAEIAMLEAHLEELRGYGKLPEIVASMEARKEATERVKANLTRVNEEAHRIDTETAALITEKTERLKSFTQTLDDISAMLEGVMNPVILLGSTDPTAGLGQSDPIESLHNALEKYLREKAIEYAAKYLEYMGLNENDALYQACIDKLSTMSSLTYLFYGDNVHGYQAGSYDINDLQSAFKQAVVVALGEIYLSTTDEDVIAELEKMISQNTEIRQDVQKCILDLETYSEEIVDFIKSEEGLCLTPYNNGLTIGYGFDYTLYPDVKINFNSDGSITEEEADRLLIIMIKDAESNLRSYLQDNQLIISQNAYDALIDLYYNRNSNALTKEIVDAMAAQNNEKVKELLDNLDYEYALKYLYSGDSEKAQAYVDRNPGLETRREDEYAIYMNGFEQGEEVNEAAQ